MNTAFYFTQIKIFAFAFACSLLSVACLNGNTSTPPPAPPNAPAMTNANTVATAENKTSAFDADKAFAHVRRQVEFGARPAGSKELAQTRDYIVKELKSYGLNVSTQEFRAPTPIGERNFANIIADLPGESSEQIILASHYDTKFYKDMRFVGANDGASSTGVVMELARVLATQNRKPPFTIRFLFFDGEEAFCLNWTDCGTKENADNTYGSRHYLKTAIANNELSKLRALILLDLVGYKDLSFPRDTNSTVWLTDIIWRTAQETGHGKVFTDERDAIDDDHTPFLEAGVNAVDIIQLGGYPYWHKAEDTLDKISPRSLKIVGDVVVKSLPRIEERLSAQKR